MTRWQRMCPTLMFAGAVLVFSLSQAPGDESAASQRKSDAADDLVLFQKEHGPKRGYHNLLIEDQEFGDFAVEAGLRCLAGVTHCGVVFRYRDAANFYRLVFRPMNQDFRVEKVVDGKSDYASTGHIRFPLKCNRWYRVRLIASGPEIEVWIDGQRRFHRDGFSEFPQGRVGVTAVDQASPEFDGRCIMSAETGEVLFEDDFNSGRLDGWEVVGPDDVRGEWSVRTKVERQEFHEDFVEHYIYQAVKSLGRTHDLLDFPGIMKLRNGELLSVFIEELQHGTPPWAAQPASGKLWMTRSADWGRSWCAPTPFLDTPLDDRHCYTLQLSDGDLLAFWWVQTVAFGAPGVFNFMSRSDDGGNTWDEPVRVRSGKPARTGRSVPGIRGGFSLTVPPSELSDGTLVMPIHCLSSVDRALPEIGILRSRDKGRTWGDYSTIAYDPEDRISFVEPAVVRLRSGKWIAVTRTEIPIYPDRTHPYKLGPTMFSTSTDEGRTWTKPRKLSLDFTWQGSTAPFLLQTESGVVVFAVNTGVAFSYDDGQTWESQTINCGYYPNLLEIAPNTVATLAAGMQGRVFSLTKPAEGSPPDDRPAPRDIRVVGLHHKSAQDSTSPGITAANRRDYRFQGRFRAVRVRDARHRRKSPLLAQPNWPLLAVARATVDANDAIIGVVRDRQRQWSDPLILAQTDEEPGDPVVVQASNGTLLCAFSVGTTSARTMLITRSEDGGGIWSPPTQMELKDRPSHSVLITSPPVEEADGTWLAVGLVGTDMTRAPMSVMRSEDAGKTWRRVADGPKSTADTQRLVEPSLAVARDGRWIVLARQVDQTGNGDDLVVTTSDDEGSSWTTPRDTGMKGIRPEIVELLDSLFIVVAETNDGRLNAAFAWEELLHFQVKPLACGYCVWAGSRKLLARGRGVDVAGEYNNLAQVPLSSEEVGKALATATRRLPAEGSEFKGDWDNRDGAFVSNDQRASAEMTFGGQSAVLVHDRDPQGRLVRVTIDGREYPPVDMSGEAEFSVRTCLAPDLNDGPHRLRLWPLLPWRQGTMFVRGVDVTVENSH